LRKVKKSPRKFILAISIFVGSILLSSCNSLKKPESNPTNISTKENINPKENDNNFIAASTDEMYFYKQIGISYICLARQAKVDFPKSISIASNNFALIVSSKHGGLIEEIGGEKLTNKQIYQGAYLQLIEGSIQLCPDLVPEEEKEKFLKTVEQLNQKD
tara:strand:+ start:90 stop:569 length:480 start_codon:yes stop_codon:yes gene_type:complete